MRHPPVAAGMGRWYAGARCPYVFESRACLGDAVTSPSAGAPRPSRQVLDRLAAAPPPYTSVVLDTSSDAPDAQHRLDTRWRDARRELVEAGAPPAVLDAVDAAVAGGHEPGDTLAVHAAEDGTAVTLRLPEAPAAEVLVRRSARPDLLPVLRHEQARQVGVVVAIDRTGADLVVLAPDAVPAAGGREEHVSGDESYVSRSAPGGWSQRRYQRTAEQRWETNATAVAERLADLVDTTRPVAVLLSGDVRAVQFLREHSPQRVAELLREVGGDYTSIDDVVEHATQELERLGVERVTAELVRHEELRGAAGRSATGVDEVLGLLGQGQVDVLLLRDDPEVLERSVVVGPGPTQVFPSPEEARAQGVAEPQQATLGDAAAWAALATDASVLLVRDEHVPEAGTDAAPVADDGFDADLHPAAATGRRTASDVLPDGVGAVLRWSSGAAT